MTPRAAACASFVALPLAASAAQVTFLPQFTLSGDADSNRRLLREARASEAGNFAGLLTIARETETGMLVLTPRVTINRYSGEDAYDSDDWGVSSRWRHQGERLAFDLQAGVADDSALATELGETGLVLGNTRRRATSASLQVTHYLSTRHVVEARVSGSDIDYARTANTGLVGYRYPSANVTYVFSITPRIESLVSVNAARLDVSDRGYSSDTRGARLGVRVRISERFDFDVSAGRSQTSAGGSRDAEQSFEAGLSWHDEVSSLSFGLSRDVEPNGRGVLVNADDLRLAYSRKLAERLTVESALRASRREDLAASAGRPDYEYGAVSLALAWKLDETWTLSLSGLHSQQKYGSVGDGSDGSRIGLGVSWQPLHP